MRPTRYAYCLIPVLAVCGASAEAADGEAPQGAAPPAVDAPAPGDDARFTVKETKDGLLRLDRQTGVVSLCREGAAGWSCAPVPDAQKTLDREMSALDAENRKLKARIGALERRLKAIARSADPEGKDAQDAPDTNEGLEGGDGTKKHGLREDDAGRNGDENLSPKERRHLDQFMDFSETALRRFFGLMKVLREEYEKGL